MKLGSKVRHVITGFEGIAIAKNEWLNGCKRVCIQPQKLKDGNPIEAIWFDAQEVQILSDKTEFMQEPTRSGGPQKDAGAYIQKQD